MLVVACFCGCVYTVLYGPAICPRCGRDDVELEDLPNDEQSGKV